MTNHYKIKEDSLTYINMTDSTNVYIVYNMDFCLKGFAYYHEVLI